MAPQKIKWKVEHDRHVLCQNFERRENWIRSESDDDWNIYWASTSTVMSIFNPEKGYRLNDHQLICHFPNHYELTRKDLMVKNIKRYLKDHQKQYDKVLSSSSSTSSSSSGTITKLENFLPQSYLLPADMSIFTEESRRSSPSSYHHHHNNNSTTWIMKPSNGAQGKGIVIINKTDHLKKFCNKLISQHNNNNNNKDNNHSNATTYVASRYIDKPYLIGGKKFDLRIYVVITSFRPLRIYLGDAFCRFCASKYHSCHDNTSNNNGNSSSGSSSSSSTDYNPFVHLTNVAIQKKNQHYNTTHGGKWKMKNLKSYLEATEGYDATQRLFDAIDDIIVHSTKAVQNVMLNDKHCFECYGYDLLIDERLKPWLIEINASPSLSATTVEDRRMKLTLVKDVLNIVMPPQATTTTTVNGSVATGQQREGEMEEEDKKKRRGDRGGGGGSSGSAGGGGGGGFCRDVGDFIVLYDEAKENERCRSGGGASSAGDERDGTKKRRGCRKNSYAYFRSP